MNLLIPWLPWIALAGAMCATWVFTTYFWLRLARVPAPAAFAAAPGVTAGIILPVTILFEKAGWFWSGARVLPGLFLFGLVGMGLFLFRPGRGRGPFTYRMRFWSWPFVATAATGWILAAWPTLTVAPPNNPPQQWDPSFHLNGVWAMTQIGIASPSQGLAPNFGGGTVRGYPTGWHAFTSLFATPTTTVQAANASSLALMLVWIISVAVYAYTLYPRRTVALAAAVIAGVLPSMPADALTMYSQWPNAASVAFLPGGAVLTILLGRSVLRSLRVPTSARELPERAPVNRSSWSTSALYLGMTLVATLGGIQAHQVYAFNLLFLLLPALIAGSALAVKSARKTARPRLGWATALFALALLAVVVWAELRPEVASLRAYPRGGVSLSSGIWHALVPNPPFQMTFSLASYNVIVALLLVLGVSRIVLSRWERARTKWGAWPRSFTPRLWPVWSYLLYAAFVFFAYGPNWEIRPWIVGPWFNDGRRVMEPMSLALVPLLAVGFSWMVAWISVWRGASMDRPSVRLQRWVGPILGVALLTASGAGAMDSRTNAARTVLDARNLGRSGMAEQEMLELMRQLPDLIPQDAVVLGDPQAGVMYSQVIGQRWAFFPQLSLLNADRETQRVIVQRFGDLNEDPEVCEAVREAGITHYVARPDGAYYSRLRSDRMPGLYNVDTSQGFDLIAQVGPTRLYLITACD